MILITFVLLGLAFNSANGLESICVHYGADTDCSEVSSRFTSTKVCDNKGKEYTDACEFYKAACAPDATMSLVYYKCNKTGLLYANTTRPTKHPHREHPTHSPYICNKIATDGCPDSWKVENLMICGNDRNIYRSRCAYDTAKCANPRLRAAWNLQKCLREGSTQEPLL
ncbi:uncharacterized protein LOC106179140 [Lingula anatina]|uniref:Uncharacterized protein LOC106179140 n=1 Tax=Lingula anatina TaxID=7574 RepID=A0A1S3K6K5_LINAN|nr:uncharacterized protein LOC106179140 [Lingula anatina]|eukprot:XP_013418132.1 uncharacterized protein LOC106179140 [Lingula anatina]